MQIEQIEVASGRGFAAEFPYDAKLSVWNVSIFTDQGNFAISAKMPNYAYSPKFRLPHYNNPLTELFLIQETGWEKSGITVEDAHKLLDGLRRGQQGEIPVQFRQWSGGIEDSALYDILPFLQKDERLVEAARYLDEDHKVSLVTVDRAARRKKRIVQREHGLLSA